jgi:hypothetical protein
MRKLLLRETEAHGKPVGAISFVAAITDSDDRMLPKVAGNFDPFRQC